MMKALSKMYNKEMLPNIWPGCVWICLMWQGSIAQGRRLVGFGLSGCLCRTHGSVFLTIFCYPFWVGTNLEIISSHHLLRRGKRRPKVLKIIAPVHTHWPGGAGGKPRSPRSGCRDLSTCFRIKKHKPKCRQVFFFSLLALHILNSHKDCMY